MSEERSQRKRRAAVEAELLKANGTLHALGVTIIEHEGEQSNIMIGKRMNEIASCYQKIDELSEQIDIQVPFDFLQYLDDGKNPNEFTRDYLERAASENQFTKGKLSTFQDFASILQEEMLSCSAIIDVKTETSPNCTTLS